MTTSGSDPQTLSTGGLKPQDEEQIAAFIDRRLSAEDRQAFMKRLDEEAELYEVFVETVRFRDQQVGRPATVIEHPASRRQWARIAAIAALVAMAIATPVVLRNLSESRYGPRLVADGLLGAALEDDWYLRPWSTMRGSSPGTDEFDTAFRLGVRHVDVEVALRLDREDDASLLAAELGLWLESVSFSEPLQLLYASMPDLALEPEAALQRLEENETLLVDHLGEDAIAFDLGKWTEAGILATQSGNTDLLASRGFRRRLRGFPRREWAESGHALAGQLDAIEGLLDAPADQLDLVRLEEAFTRIFEDR